MNQSKMVTERLDHEHLGRVLVARRLYLDAVDSREMGSAKKASKRTLNRKPKSVKLK